MYRIPVFRVQLVRESSQNSEVRQISNPKAAADLLRLYLEGSDREYFVELFLDAKNQCRGIHTVSVGTLNSSLIHPREVFKAAILANSASIVLGHNHPSGNPEPSEEDIAVTKRLAKVGETMGIEVLDHVILGSGGFYVSLKEWSAF